MEAPSNFFLRDHDHWGKGSTVTYVKSSRLTQGYFLTLDDFPDNIQHINRDRLFNLITEDLRQVADV